MIPQIRHWAIAAAWTVAVAMSVASPAVAATAGTDSTTAAYFYHGRDYGSEGLVSPLRLIINGGFGILKMENRSNRLGDIHWQNGWTNLWFNLSHPIAAINDDGWWHFLQTEVVPISFDKNGGQYWPNYMNHLVGGGMSYRMMREWYRWHGFRHDTLWALATMSAYHLLNETVEMDDKTGYRVDPIADIYIFNWLGFVVYSSDRVCHFMSHTLHMADWSSLPFYDPRRGTLENTEQNFMVRLRLGSTTPWHLFYHWGNSGEIGLSRQLGHGHYLSVGGGFEAKTLLKVDQFSDTVDLAATYGLFYDREGSLLASLFYTKNRDNRLRLNLYPGLFSVASLRPGLSLILTQESDVLVGLTFGTLPLPLGLGTRLEKGDG